MELKEYQQNTLKRVKAYLEALKNWRVKNEKVVAAIGKSDALDVPLKAWEEIGGKNYRSRKNGIGEALPNFCLKIPTGGGKTLLAARTVDLVNRSCKKQVFKLCNKLAEQKSWTELGLEFPERKIVFELVFGDEWQKVLNRLLK